MSDAGGGYMNIKMKRGDVVRIGGGILIQLVSDGESSARVCVTAPKAVPIIIERGIPSPFRVARQSDI